MPALQEKRALTKAEYAFETEANGVQETRYNAIRDKLLTIEKEKRFDADALKYMTPLEVRAHGVAELVKKSEDDTGGIYDPKATPIIFKGAPFLHNVNAINTKSRMFPIAQHMPKGAHHHIHFNACLEPNFFFDLAVTIDAMHIRTNKALINPAAFDDCEVQFEVRPIEPVSATANPFQGTWQPAMQPWGEWIQFSSFRQTFPGVHDFAAGQDGAIKWLVSKIVLTAEQVYQHPQNIPGIWNLFNIGTRLLKGLFNYETAHRKYVAALVADFVTDNITYAEIRVTFPGNKVMRDDASGSLTTKEVCALIEEEMDTAIQALPAGKFFHGFKLIYCVPKLQPKNQANYMRDAMTECIELKKAFPNLICGFDGVGWEDLTAIIKPIHNFLPELLEFRERCLAENLDIPFALHAGETLGNGDKADHNLVDAILLGAKRIGHGYSLLNHPDLMQIVKERNICLEVCPIGNEILRLTPDGVKGHNMVGLLANDVHCTLNCDNATYYSSTLSHDFYQLLISSEYMSIMSWKVLAGWSIEHSLMTPAEKLIIWQRFQDDWVTFCKWIIATYQAEDAVWTAAHPEEPAAAVEEAPKDTGVTKHLPHWCYVYLGLICFIYCFILICCILKAE